ncbi:M48 family metallopeptidase [Butyricicoccus sp.]|uniref:M48 family metallopeptidase n=1 Tax=Butyricicoccus sp. TaxID=2049021 RepID=UPI003AADA080
MRERIIAGISVQIVRKRIRSMNLTVRPPEGTVRLSVPTRTSNRVIDRFVQEHESWIHVQQEKIRMEYPQHQYQSGECMYHFGEPLHLLVQETGRRGSVRRTGDVLLLSAPKDSTPEQRKAWVEAWQRTQLHEQAEHLLTKWADIIGVEVREWHIKRMRTRWGTCNYAAHRIWLSLALAEKPLPCVEYVVVHELCHLLEASHNERFWAYVERYLPDWRERKQKLNESVQ